MMKILSWLRVMAADNTCFLSAKVALSLLLTKQNGQKIRTAIKIVTRCPPLMSDSRVTINADITYPEKDTNTLP